MKNVFSFKSLMSAVSVMVLSMGAVACSSTAQKDAAPSPEAGLVRTDNANGSQVVPPPAPGASSAGRAR